MNSSIVSSCNTLPLFNSSLSIAIDLNFFLYYQHNANNNRGIRIIQNLKCILKSVVYNN